MLNTTDAALMLERAIARWKQTKDDRTLRHEIAAIHAGLNRIPPFLQRAEPMQPSETLQ